jgi:hypothetical protein
MKEQKRIQDLLSISPNSLVKKLLKQEKAIREMRISYFKELQHQKMEKL